MQSLINFLVSTLGLSQGFVENRIDDIRTSCHVIFWLSFFLPLIMIFSGAAADSRIIWKIAGYIALVNVILAGIVYNAPSWAVLLILPVTREEADAAMKKFLLPVIFWYALIASMLYEFIPPEAVSVGDLFLLILLILVLSIGTALLGGDGKNTIRLFILIVVFRILIMIAGWFFPEFIVGIKANIIVPAYVFLKTLILSGTLGTLYVLAWIGSLLAVFVGLAKAKGLFGRIFLLALVSVVGYFLFPSVAQQVTVQAQPTTQNPIAQQSAQQLLGIQITLPEPNTNDYTQRDHNVWVYNGYSMQVKAGQTMTSSNQQVWFRYEGVGGKVYQQEFSAVNGRLPITTDGVVFFTRKNGGGPITAVIEVKNP